MANRNAMGFMMRGDNSSPSARPNVARPVRSVERNAADDDFFVKMHRNKANFSIEKVGAVFANLPRRKIG